MKAENNQHLPDWQRGEDSKLSPLERVELMNEWLAQNKQDILTKPISHQEEQSVGFIDID